MSEQDPESQEWIADIREAASLDAVKAAKPVTARLDGRGRAEFLMRGRFGRERQLYRTRKLWVLPQDYSDSYGALLRLARQIADPVRGGSRNVAAS